MAREGSIRALVLPNFDVKEIGSDDSTIFAANKLVAGMGYWFLKFFPDVETHVIDNSAPFPLRVLGGRAKIELFQPFRAILAQSEYDVLISHSYNSGFLLSLLRSFVGCRRPPHVIIDVGCLNGGRGHAFQVALLRFALRSVAGLVYHSSVNEEFYKRYFPKIRRAFVPFGTDPASFKPFDRPSSGSYALSIGSGKRDYALLIDAWREIDFPLKIVGTTKLDVRGRKSIELVPRVNIARLKEYIHDSRFVVLPVTREAYSAGQTTLTQCMSMAKAVIVTDVPGVADYVNDGINCLAVRSGDTEDLTKKVKLLIENPDVVKAISVNARNDVIERFSEEKMASGIIDFMRTVGVKLPPK